MKRQLSILRNAVADAASVGSSGRKQRQGWETRRVAVRAVGLEWARLRALSAAVEASWWALSSSFITSNGAPLAAA